MVCTMYYVTKTTPIQFIDGNKLKSCGTGLINHTQPVSCHWLLMPLGAEIHMQTHTDAQTKMISRSQAYLASGSARLV